MRFVAFVTAYETELRTNEVNDAIIESVLRDELRKHGGRWCKLYQAMSDSERIELLGKLSARRMIDEARRTKPEPDELPEGPTCGTLQSGTGGGKRVIHKGGPFS